MANDVMEKIEGQVKKANVVVYMKGTPDAPQCGFSAHTMDILKTYGYPFETVDVLSDPEVREGIKKYSNWPTIPQIYINSKFIGGCDIISELHEKGELTSIIKGAFEK